MDKFLQNISPSDLVQALMSLLGVCGAAYLGYLTSVRKASEETKQSNLQASRTAEQEFRDDLIKQLEDSSLRLDRQMQRWDEREKKINELVAQLDIAWADKVELKAEKSTLAAELRAANKKIEELSAELEKFERKVWYIAPKEDAPKS